jgi:hypothetical protein
MNYEKEIEELLKSLPHKLQVRFALDCALDVKHLMGPESIQALDVVGKWLKGEATQAEVEAAYHAATAAIHAAYYNAANADYAAYHAAQSADYAAYHAAQSANYAAYHAAQSAYHAAAAAENRDKKIKEYYEKAKTIISNLSELEKLVYDV